jgi:hypothetical protein
VQERRKTLGLEVVEDYDGFKVEGDVNAMAFQRGTDIVEKLLQQCVFKNAKVRTKGKEGE